MGKQGLLLLFLVVMSCVGVGYAILTDPELLPRQVFSESIKAFAANAKTLELQFKKDGKFKPTKKELKIKLSANPIGFLTNTFSIRDNPHRNTSESAQLEKDLAIQMRVGESMVTLVFPEVIPSISNQTVILAPYFENEDIQNIVRWRCIDGSFLVRFRSKPCRIGKGILISDFSESD